MFSVKKPNKAIEGSIIFFHLAILTRHENTSRDSFMFNISWVIQNSRASPYIQFEVLMSKVLTSGFHLAVLTQSSGTKHLSNGLTQRYLLHEGRSLEMGGHPLP